METSMSQFRMLGLLVFTLFTLVACSGQDGSLELTDNQKNLVAERIAPHGSVVMAGQAVVSAVASAVGRTGESIYSSNCQGCHNYGIAGSPKMGDIAAWADRLTKGIETVYANAINGIGGMPAKGTCMDCSDDEIIATIDYMLENSK
jgi:cytochrome c5